MSKTPLRQRSSGNNLTISKSHSGIFSQGLNDSFSGKHSGKDGSASKAISRNQSCVQIEAGPKEFRFSITSILGHRESNEDAHAQFKFNNLVVAAIFDGHNGDKASQLCGLSLEKTFKNHYNQHINKNPDEINIEGVLEDTVMDLNNQVLSKPGLNETGTTSLIVVVDKINSVVHVSNVGDCRFIIGYKDNSFQQTKDQKPSDPVERERIEKLGGKVTEVNGVFRINKILACARSIGDKYMKEFVKCKQDYYKFPIANSCYMILGCDGLFDEYSSDEVHNMLMQVVTRKITDRNLFDELNGKKDINTSAKKSDADIKQMFENVDMTNSLQKRITQALSKMAFFKGSTDNISVMFAFVQGTDLDSSEGKENKFDQF